MDSACTSNSFHVSAALYASTDPAGYLPTNVSAVAAENPDGTYGLVLLNEGNEGVSFTIEDGTRHFLITLPAQSITSCVW